MWRPDNTARLIEYYKSYTIFAVYDTTVHTQQLILYFFFFFLLKSFSLLYKMVIVNGNGSSLCIIIIHGDIRRGQTNRNPCTQIVLGSSLDKKTSKMYTPCIHQILTLSIKTNVEWQPLKEAKGGYLFLSWNNSFIYDHNVFKYVFKIIIKSVEIWMKMKHQDDNF
jgi:hypothetical protein